MKPTKMLRYVRDLRASLGCFLCGEDDAGQLTFHHVNPEDKKFAISTYCFEQEEDAEPTEELMQEIAKCVVLC